MQMMELTREVRDKRIAVARDVLLRVNTTKWRRSWYLQGDVVLTNMDEDDDMQVHVDAIQKECSACLIGGFILSTVRLFDALPLRKVAKSIPPSGGSTGYTKIDLDNQDIEDAVNDVFDVPMLCAIECAFMQHPTPYFIDGVNVDDEGDLKFDRAVCSRACDMGRDIWNAAYIQDHDSKQHVQKANAAVVAAVAQNIIDNNGEFIP